MQLNRWNTCQPHGKQGDNHLEEPLQLSTGQIKGENHMNITIIGTGNMARGIGTRLLAGGHSVSLVGRAPSKAEDLAAQLQETARNGATVTAVDGGVLPGKVVVLAVHYTAVAPIIQQYGDQLASKIIVDITNPIDFNTLEPIVAPGSSAAEEIAKIAPAGSKVVKAFNTTFAEMLVAGQVAGQPLDVFIATDDEATGATVAQLVRDGGLHPIDVGGLARAQQLEALALLGITLQFRLNTGFQTGWKLLLPQQA
jgi:NADPH-dependent F420 reductase